MIGRKQINDPAGFQDGQPAFHGRNADPQIAGKIGKIQHLGAPRRKELDKTLKIAKISDIMETADIPFEIGLDIRAVPGRRVERRREDKFRVGTPQPGVNEILERSARTEGFAPLRDGKGQEVQQGDAAGQGIAQVPDQL